MKCIDCSIELTKGDTGQRCFTCKQKNVNNATACVNTLQNPPSQESEMYPAEFVLYVERQVYVSSNEDWFKIIYTNKEFKTLPNLFRYWHDEIREK